MIPGDTPPSGTAPSGTAPSGTPPNDNDFVAEIKERFQRDIELITHLDNKANNMVTMSGAISTALLSIASFLVSIINKQTWVFGLEIVIIFIGVSLSALAIRYFLLALKTRDFREVFASRDFFKNGKYDKKLANEFLSADKKSFEELRIKEYLTSNYENYSMILEKGKNMKYGQALFGASIISVSIVLVSVLLFSAAGQTNLSFTTPKNETMQSNNSTQISSIAGPDQTIDEDSIAVLKVAVVTDENQKITSYKWTQISGPTVNLTGSNSAAAIFRAPNVISDTDLGFQVTIVDSKNSASVGQTVVHIKNKLELSGEKVPRFILPYESPNT